MRKCERERAAQTLPSLNRSELICLVRAFRLYLYGNTVLLVKIMDSISVNKFRDNLKTFVEQVVTNHTPIKVTRRSGEDFIVMSAEDWERERETLYILQNNSLMLQIADSISTHSKGEGYKPNDEDMNEITDL